VQELRRGYWFLISVGDGILFCIERGMSNHREDFQAKKEKYL
jgi:hypothetical protein